LKESERRKIFFVHSGNETFVKLDRDLLSASFDIYAFYAVRKFPIGLIQCWRGLKDADILFCWFASWNSFWALLLAKLLRKPSLLVIGGYDVADLPSANYGSQRGGIAKWISRWAMKLANWLIPFSNYSQQEAERNANVSSNSIKMIYIGVPDPFGSLPNIPKEKIALTVGNVDRQNLKRKGIEPFVHAAAQLPDVQFVVVGTWADDSIDYLRSIASPNVLFTGRVSDKELLDYYRRASVYVQASLHEGFGLSVAEAMLAGCIPVITRAGSLPEVVGDCGHYSDSPEPSDVAKAIEIALISSMSMRARARERILRNFPIEQRKQLVEQLILSLWNNSNAK